jgi:hypothetical protein
MGCQGKKHLLSFFLFDRVAGPERRLIMEVKTKKIITFWTLEQWHWLTSMAQAVGVLRGKKLKVYRRWSILIERWVADGRPKVPLLDNNEAGYYSLCAPIEVPLWNELVRSCCELTIEREMLLSVAVLARSILDYYMHKESSDAFARRCFEDLPAESNHSKTPLQGVAGSGRLHQG